MRVLAGWLGALFYALGQGVLPAGRFGRALARQFLRQSLTFSPQHHRARSYLDYLLGVRDMEGGDPQAALPLLRRAAKALPADAAVRLDAAIVMTACGEYQSAEAEFNRLLQEHPRRVRNEPQLWFALAWSQLRLGQYSRCEATARRGAEAGAATVQLRLAALLAGFGNGTALDEEGLQQVLNTRPQLLPHLLEFVEQLVESHQASLASQLLQALPAAIQPDCLRLLAGSALNSERLEVARWALHRWKDSGASPVERLVLASELHLHEGRFKEAIALAREAVSMDSASARAQERLGEALLLGARLDEAYPAFEAALQGGSSSSLAAGVLALRLLEQGDLTGARSLFRSQRRGGALGCALANAATASLRLQEDRLPESLRCANLAWEQFSEQPSWGRQPVVCDLLTDALLHLLEALLARGTLLRKADLDNARELRENILSSPPARPTSLSK